jgi:hypothetical protein
MEKAMQHEVTWPHAACEQGAGRHFLPGKYIVLRQADIGRATCGARRRLDLHDILERGSQMLAERRRGCEAGAQVLLGGEWNPRKIVDRADAANIDFGFAKTPPVESRARIQVVELPAQALLLKAADSRSGRRFNTTESSSDPMRECQRLSISHFHCPFIGDRGGAKAA